jgi:hypothetical protein
MFVTFNSIVYWVPLTHLKRTLYQIALQFSFMVVGPAGVISSEKQEIDQENSCPKKAA